MAKENEIVLFETEDKEITLNVKVDQDTVWLNRICYSGKIEVH